MNFLSENPGFCTPPSSIYIFNERESPICLGFDLTFVTSGVDVYKKKRYVCHVCSVVETQAAQSLGRLLVCRTFLWLCCNSPFGWWKQTEQTPPCPPSRFQQTCCVTVLVGDVRSVLSRRNEFKETESSDFTLYKNVLIARSEWYNLNGIAVGSIFIQCFCLFCSRLYKDRSCCEWSHSNKQHASRESVCLVVDFSMVSNKTTELQLKVVVYVVTKHIRILL